MIHRIFETMLYQAAEFFKKTYIQVIQVNTFFSDSESLALKSLNSRALHLDVFITIPIFFRGLVRKILFRRTKFRWISPVLSIL